MNVELIVVAFDKADKAAQALEDVRALEQTRAIWVINAAVLANNDGKVSVKEAEDVDARHGALFGAITGGLLGLLAGPAGVIVGAAAGAATGGLAAQGIDMGFPNAALDDLRDTLQPNSSALVLLIENRWVEKVAEDLAYLEGKLYRYALEAEVAAQFAAAEAEMEQQKAAPAAKQAAVGQELDPVFDSGLESPLLKEIQKAMKVYDRQGDKIGEVESIYLGSVNEAADAFGLGPESTDDADLDGGTSWAEALAKVFADDDELPEELHSRLLRHGFIRIGGSGLFASDYYASSDQIASVSEDRVQLNCLKDQLIKR